MKGIKKGITVAGTLISDVFHKIESYPAEGLLTNVLDTSKHIGGSGNIILDLAKLDPSLPVKVCAVIGKDENGENLLSVLSRYPNINTENISIGDTTPCTIIMNADDTKQRTFFFVSGASDDFGLAHVRFERLDTKIFHLEYLLLMKKADSPDATFGTHGARILYEAQKRGYLTSIDVVSEQSDRAKGVVSCALKYTDICCINEYEAQAVTETVLCENGTLNRERVFAALEKIAALGARKWVVIHAPNESFGLDVERKAFVRVPSLALPKGYIKGTTGAGDAYCAGILYGAHEDFALDDAMRLARACAACSLSESNGTDGMQSYREVLKAGEAFAALD